VGLLRPRLHRTLGILGEDEEIGAEAREATSRYLADPSSVPSDLTLRSLGIAASTGDAALWEACRKRFEAARAPDERSTLLEALGMFRDRAIVENALAYVLVGPLRPPETFTIPRQLEGDPELEAVAYAWMKEHYDEIVRRIPPWGATFLPYFASGCSIDRVADARVFFADPEKAPPGTSKSLEKVAEAVSACERLRERTRTDVLAFLRKADAASSAPAAAHH
jgi:alanyl aminopeptidase